MGKKGKGKGTGSDVLFRVGVESHPQTRQVLDDFARHIGSTQAAIDESMKRVSGRVLSETDRLKIAIEKTYSAAQGSADRIAGSFGKQLENVFASSTAAAIAGIGKAGTSAVDQIKAAAALAGGSGGGRNLPGMSGSRAPSAVSGFDRSFGELNKRIDSLSRSSSEGGSRRKFESFRHGAKSTTVELETATEGLDDLRARFMNARTHLNSLAEKTKELGNLSRTARGSGGVNNPVATASGDGSRVFVVNWPAGLTGNQPPSPTGFPGSGPSGDTTRDAEQEADRLHKRHRERQLARAKFNRSVREDELKARVQAEQDAAKKIIGIQSEQARAEQRMGQAKAQMANSLQQGATAVMQLARGFTMLGIADKETTEQMIKSLATVQGYFDMVVGGVQSFRVLSRAYTSYNDLMKAGSAATAGAQKMEAMRVASLAREAAAANAAAVANDRLNASRGGGLPGVRLPGRGVRMPGRGMPLPGIPPLPFIGGAGAGAGGLTGGAGALGLAGPVAALAAAVVGVGAALKSGAGTASDISNYGFGGGAKHNSFTDRVATAEVRAWQGLAGFGDRAMKAAGEFVGIEGGLRIFGDSISELTDRADKLAKQQKLQLEHDLTAQTRREYNAIEIERRQFETRTANTRDNDRVSLLAQNFISPMKLQDRQADIQNENRDLQREMSTNQRRMADKSPLEQRAMQREQDKIQERIDANNRRSRETTPEISAQKTAEAKGLLDVQQKLAIDKKLAADAKLAAAERALRNAPVNETVANPALRGTRMSGMSFLPGMSLFGGMKGADDQRKQQSIPKTITIDHSEDRKLLAANAKEALDEVADAEKELADIKQKQTAIDEDARRAKMADARAHLEIVRSELSEVKNIRSEIQATIEDRQKGMDGMRERFGRMEKSEQNELNRIKEKAEKSAKDFERTGLGKNDLDKLQAARVAEQKAARELADARRAAENVKTGRGFLDRKAAADATLKGKERQFSGASGTRREREGAASAAQMKAAEDRKFLDMFDRAKQRGIQGGNEEQFISSEMQKRRAEIEQRKLAAEASALSNDELAESEKLGDSRSVARARAGFRNRGIAAGADDFFADERNQNASDQRRGLTQAARQQALEREESQARRGVSDADEQADAFNNELARNAKLTVEQKLNLTISDNTDAVVAAMLNQLNMHLDRRDKVLKDAFEAAMTERERDVYNADKLRREQASQ